MLVSHTHACTHRSTCGALNGQTLSERKRFPVKPQQDHHIMFKSLYSNLSVALEQNDLQRYPTGFYIQNKKSIRTRASKYFNCPAVEFSWTNIFIFRLDESLHWSWKRLNHVCVASTLAGDVWAERPVILFSYKYETTLHDKIHMWMFTPNHPS